MDWDKANFKKINQRTAESKRWEARDGTGDETEAKKKARKGPSRQPSKKKKRSN
ncbi:MAG: hypothetical protein AAF065_02465 [Verrucomicrobiota bacterium]